MTNNMWTPKAGMAGMGGAALWLLSVILEYSLGLQPPGGTGPLYLANQLLALAGLAGITFGLCGLWWGGAVNGRLGKTSVGLFVLGYLLIIIAGIFVLFLKEDESPIFILFPIGGLLMDVGALLTGTAVVRTKQWPGWQRWMPLIYAAYLWLAIELPFIMGVFPDGPGFFLEVFQGLGLFLLGVAVYTQAGEETR